MVEFLTPIEMIEKMVLVIEDQRLLQNLQQKELAKKSGIALPTYKDFIYKKRISFENLLKLLIALNLFDKIESLLKKDELKTLSEIKDEKKLPKRIVKRRVMR
jgi:transcriptional regulator with XRE-family HTH domain